eukprot:TRINITY_DN6050_c0_g1_i2.p1 TRINITY_DN6050_c0_g1~~TRINITY_DN6050_c0_g1_i2.p1  ORF type:complete len:206 (-),score=17.00 TRINITY_DN6050_c0_g1_i2:286-903(-)
MAWVNHYLPPHICPITNFDSDLVDSRVYFHPLGMLWGKEEVLGENQKLTDPVERANLVVSMAKVISFDKFIDSRAILNGDSLVNSLFLSYLLDLRPYVGIYSVCFTQCLQNDFCGLGSPSNNVLHVGNQEAQRLHMEGDKFLRSSNHSVFLNSRDSAHSIVCYWTIRTKTYRLWFETPTKNYKKLFFSESFQALQAERHHVVSLS